MEWKEYKKSDIKHFNGRTEVKTNDGKVHSVWNVVGVTILKVNGDEIDINDILFWREKRDFERYKTLQKHYDLLEKYDSETLDDLEYAISDTYDNNEEKEAIHKLISKLRKHINYAQATIFVESKKYL